MDTIVQEYKGQITSFQSFVDELLYLWLILGLKCD